MSIPVSNSLADDDSAVLLEFIAESQADMERIADQLTELCDPATDGDLTGAIYGALRSLTVNSAFMGLMQIRRLAHESAELIHKMHRHILAPTPAIVEVMQAAVDEMIGMLQRARINAPAITDQSFFDDLIARLSNFPEKAGNDQTPDAAKKSAVAPLQLPYALTCKLTGAGECTLRIPEQQLDRFQHFKAELSELQKMLKVSADGSVNRSVEAADSLARIIAGMETYLGPLCAVPAAILLQEAPLIAHETATVTGKTVQVHLDGENARIPEGIAKKLSSPLKQMIRNAVDHGIEPPVERRQACKITEGRVWVELRRQKDAVILRIADDGAGIDFRGILAKALSMEIYPRNQTLTPADITNLLFMPGVAAARPTSVSSSRAEGLTLARQQVDALGGNIRVSSKAGQGTEFTITIPGIF